MTILIAGGGIGGLTLALMLQKRGIKSVIYEQAGQIREVGVGINILPHAIKELAALGLLPELDAVGIRTKELIYINRLGQKVWSETARHGRRLRISAILDPSRAAAKGRFTTRCSPSSARMRCAPACASPASFRTRAASPRISSMRASAARARPCAAKCSSPPTASIPSRAAISIPRRVRRAGRARCSGAARRNGRNSCRGARCISAAAWARSSRSIRSRRDRSRRRGSPTGRS